MRYGSQKNTVAEWNYMIFLLTVNNETNMFNYETYFKFNKGKNNNFI